MATLPLGYSLLDETNKETNKINNKSNNKTIRRKRAPVNSKKVKQFLNFMKNSEQDDTQNNELEKPLVDFNPPSFPLLPHQPDEMVDNGYPDKLSTVTPFDEDEDDDTICSEGFESLNGDSVNADYYKQYEGPPQINNSNNREVSNSQYMPNYSNLTNNPAIAHNADTNGLMKKLNYMIHLLEEQQDEKTENITEELVLYLFLGVFVIFVCDSFTKVGKYKR